MNKRQKRKKLEILAEGKFIRMLREDGWEYVNRCNCSGIVIILALTDDQKVIFVEQYRLPVRGQVIEFPAGLMNDGSARHHESVAAAAKRELLEETGYLARKIVKVMRGPAGSGFKETSTPAFDRLRRPVD